MKNIALLTMLLSLAAPLSAADLSPKDDVLAAAKKLGEQANYTWHTEVVVPEDAQFKPGPSDGKTEKDGFTHVKMDFFGNETQIVKKGPKGAITNQDGAWQSTTELEGEGPAQFLRGMVDSLKTPAMEAADLAKSARDLKKSGDAVASELTEEGAKSLFRFGNATNPKGSVKFWIKDGMIVKYEFAAKAKVEFGENEFQVDRTTTVVVKEVGTTKVTVPEEAKKKVS